MPIEDQGGKVVIRLATGELWSEGGKVKEFADWQAAQREYAEGRVPSGIEKELKDGKASTSKHG